MSTGKVEQWIAGPGEGMIKDEKGQRLAFSQSDLQNPAERGNLRQGDKVQFEVDQPGHATGVKKA
ncbi:hypothetical protein AV521_11380 [Streptomyces sp. IMTB 2501]|uniref:hypothetical protein n=1 Tax=Streptomyces sp. IMTB 2501 TaxID=1776340 RepID=UPI00096E1B30|nr:hypothetical protein [Streptomyces sp. IMTB 2501]OLZ71527.1 hypothetical protein AV521_11380 [Streptomyces sp. IMTB 2501]